MVELVLKDDIKKEKIDALLHFLKIWDIDIEVKNRPKAKFIPTILHGEAFYKRKPCKKQYGRNDEYGNYGVPEGVYDRTAVEG